MDRFTEADLDAMLDGREPSGMDNRWIRQAANQKYSAHACECGLAGAFDGPCPKCEPFAIQHQS